MLDEDANDHIRRVDALEHGLRLGRVEQRPSVGQRGCQVGNRLPIAIQCPSSRSCDAPLRESLNHAYRSQRAANTQGLIGDLILRRMTL
jgi:hypothetical protein